MRIVGDAAGVERIPEWDRHAERTLTAHTPVGVEPRNPVLVPAAQIRRMPGHLPTCLDQLFLLVDDADEPSPAGDQLQRLAPLLVVLHDVLDRPWLAPQRLRLLESTHHLVASRLHATPYQAIVHHLRPDGINRSPPFGTEH